MREFLFTLTYNKLTDKKELNFIVGETSTPPTWNTVKDHVTKITRAFDGSSLKSRRIYFSATEKLAGISIDATTGDATMSGAVVDLSQDGKTESEITKADAAGIMVPASSYYVFVYDDAGGLVKQQQVTTAGYPSQASDFTEQVGAPGGRTSGADIGEYIWGMDGWKNPSGVYDIVKDVEVKQGEVFFLPMRVRSPNDWDISGTTNSYCTGSVGKELSLRATVSGAASLAVAVFTPSGISTKANLFSFTNSSSLFSTPLANNEKDETFDLMYLAKVGDIKYELIIVCFDSGFLSTFSDLGNIFFTLITE